MLNHLQGHSHADVQHNELVLFQCDGEIEEMEGDAQGGVVAGDLTIKDTQLHSKYKNENVVITWYNVRCDDIPGISSSLKILKNYFIKWNLVV